MGHGCEFIDPENGNKPVASFYISYNYSRDEDEFCKYWYIAEAHGKSGAEIFVQTTLVLEKLAKAGYSPIIPDGMDGWSRDMNVFMSHVKRLNELSKQYPTCYLYSDSLDPPQPKEVKEEDAESTAYTYYRHPTKGILLVNSYETAIDVFACEYKKDKQRAVVWLEFAERFLNR